MEELEINNKDYLYKIIGFLQTNWAFVQPENSDTGGCIVKFVNNRSELMDELKFDSKDEAYSALKKNGFMGDDEYLNKYRSNESMKKPLPPYTDNTKYESNRIYSSGRYWK
jgi:TFIIF-interacting CTD phosphatase-like protein